MNPYKILIRLLTVVFAALLLSCNHDNKNAASTVTDSVSANVVAKPVDEILKQFNDKIAADGNNAELYYLRSKYYMQLQKLNLARDDAEKAITIDSTKAEYYVTLSDIYLFMNDTRKTNDVLVSCLKIDPKNKEANFRMSELQFYIKHYDEAIRYGVVSLKADEKNLKINYLLGMIWKEKGDTARAVSYFRTCIDINPEYFDVYDQLGYIEKARNKPIAMDYFNTALKINPESITSLYGRALCYQNKNDFDNAIKDYTAITQLKPDMTDAYFNMGYIHQVNLKMYREAIKYYNEALGVDSNFTKAVYNKGYCFEQLGDIGNARMAYQKCIDMEPKFIKAREGLKRVMK